MATHSFFANLKNGISINLKKLFVNPYREVNINWFKLKYYKHLPTGKIRTHLLFDKNFYFYSATELLHGLKEIFIDNIYKQRLSVEPYIIDCGANIGMSIIYMKKLYPKAEIVAFEPDETNFGLLQKNITSFNYSNVSLFKEAVWKENTTLLFSNESSMGSKIDKNGINSITVKAVRLKNYLNRRIDFLKIDIEGAEYEVLKDISNELQNVENMFLEYHGSFQQNNELVEMIQIVRDAGFNFYIKEAASIYETPFFRIKNPNTDYDIQLNIFCFRN
ncbi:FkbM family methyltransferase [Parasediminibacterium paludis]|uniref:FkbM family methyltransferase n=1 Tax=Parasediminibacterium paludis TaxID=908966 RepID=A0ABV8PU58_9BACT